MIYPILLCLLGLVASSAIASTSNASPHAPLAHLTFTNISCSELADFTANVATVTELKTSILARTPANLLAEVQPALEAIEIHVTTYQDLIHQSSPKACPGTRAARGVNASNVESRVHGNQPRTPGSLQSRQMQEVCDMMTRLENALELLQLPAELLIERLKQLMRCR
ncbi:uncharacterized protein DSM5745_00250 [Aspergillus mulundensis]|uniref:Cell wall protein n=1 Tax=Aspergillus mulundensis TaxID=1810919 RepID=A0A3D8T4K4_9EURO|nr:hypothetical protein DSM5745_00250 [Aspergillus mulundensis]RDW92928.1 hypothetical protein DSM5745_00250 [Aspergillus mulundensis]